MTLALIVAVSENGVIGNQGDLPWRLSADLLRFKRITMGHHLIMGRKTFESIGRLLPGRTTVIVTRQSDYKFDGAIVVDSAARAREVVSEDTLPFVVGGGEIYALFLPWATRLYRTQVHANVEGDTIFPNIDGELWEKVESEHFSADLKNNFDYSFDVYQRKNGLKPALHQR